MTILPAVDIIDCLQQLSDDFILLWMELKPLGHLILADPYDLSPRLCYVSQQRQLFCAQNGLATAIPGYVLHLTGQ